jgi:DNA repair protein RadC
VVPDCLLFAMSLLQARAELVEIQSTTININATNIFFIVILDEHDRVINTDLSSNGTSSIELHKRDSLSSHCYLDAHHIISIGHLECF